VGEGESWDGWRSQILTEGGIPTEGRETHNNRHNGRHQEQERVVVGYQVDSLGNSMPLETPIKTVEGLK
jgi:hypothetical protein